jgi:hypothetical protein
MKPLESSGDYQVSKFVPTDAFPHVVRKEDNQFPGFYFKTPMMIVLDSLKSDNPSLRRVGETWMRCNLKSYIR